MHMKKFTLVCLLVVSYFFTNGNDTGFAKKITPGFIENKGQVADQFGNSRSDVRFIYSATDFKVIPRTTGFSLEWSRATANLTNFPESGVESLSNDEDEIP